MQSCPSFLNHYCESRRLGLLYCFLLPPPPAHLPHHPSYSSASSVPVPCPSRPLISNNVGAKGSTALSSSVCVCYSQSGGNPHKPVSEFNNHQSITQSFTYFSHSPSERYRAWREREGCARETHYDWRCGEGVAVARLAHCHHLSRQEVRPAPFSQIVGYIM